MIDSRISSIRLRISWTIRCWPSLWTRRNPVNRTRARPKGCHIPEMDQRKAAGLLDSSLTLQPAYVGGDFRYVFRGHACDLRHVSKVPMVGPDASGRRHLKGSIAMVAWLIDFVNQRRTLIRANRPIAMTSCTVCLEFAFALLKRLGNRKRIPLRPGRTCSRRDGQCKDCHHDEQVLKVCP